jgi:hypothetical protein
VTSMLDDRAVLAKSAKVASRDLAIWAALTDFVCDGAWFSCYSINPSRLHVFISYLEYQS